MMLKSTLKWLISPILFLLLGICVGSPVWLHHTEWLKWSELNLSNALSILGLVINTILAVVIVLVLQKLQDIQRVEKNILISRLEEELKCIKDFVDGCCVIGNQVDFSTVTSFFKTINIRISKITDTHSNCKKETDDLFEETMALNSLLTDPKGTDDLKINNNKISLTPKRIQEIKIQIAEVQNRTLELIICINRQASKRKG